MAFNPRTEYQIIPSAIKVRHFHSYRSRYVTRPPYQRKSVWGKKKQQDLLDSLFRRYYIPKLVIREVRLSDNESVNEVIDGQQRINTVQDFFGNKVKLPKSLGTINESLPGKYFDQLNDEQKEFVEEELSFAVDKITGIENPRNPIHQKIATEIFWRLQQGESLNFMEIAHAKLDSLKRNFVVKYSDDITFDFDSYVPIDSNPNKHKFFKILDRDNNRMQHLMLMSRFGMIEEANEYIDLKDTALTEYIKSGIQEDGIGNYSYENENVAKEVIRNLNELYDIFGSDSMIDSKNGIKELKREYIIISLYMLIRHFRKHYVVSDEIKGSIRDFYINYFYPKWQEGDVNDTDMVSFINNRQQSLLNLQTRDMIVRQLFFDYCGNHQIEIKAKDSNRAFNESQRIKIYRRDKGICQYCLDENKPEKECVVSWSDYQADHVFPHSRGGLTDLDNSQVLCTYHNQKKSDN